MIKNKAKLTIMFLVCFMLLGMQCSQAESIEKCLKKMWNPYAFAAGGLIAIGKDLGGFSDGNTVCATTVIIAYNVLPNPGQNIVSLLKNSGSGIAGIVAYVCAKSIQAYVASKND
jgi:hypothetical protein